MFCFDRSVTLQYFQRGASTPVNFMSVLVPTCRFLLYILPRNLNNRISSPQASLFHSTKSFEKARQSFDC